MILVELLLAMVATRVVLPPLKEEDVLAVYLTQPARFAYEFVRGLQRSELDLGPVWARVDVNGSQLMLPKASALAVADVH